MRRLPLLLSMGLVLSVAVASYVAWRRHTAQITTSAQQHLAIQYKDNSDCDLAKKTCTAQFADMHLQVVLPQQPIYLKPFALTVHTSGNSSAAITSVRAHFFMQAMQMPIPVTTLHAMPSADDGERTWQGNAILPVCVSGRHDWRVVIEMETTTTRYRVQNGMSMAGSR